MSLKSGFILAAGHGTRMGFLGESYPKPLWPVFEYSLLELCLHQLKNLGVEKIYANTHHRAELIKTFVESKKLEVELLFEPELLGSGGAFHNLKMKTDGPNILALNSDCLYLFNNEIVESLNNQATGAQHLLLGQKVEGGSGYNEWLTQNEELRGISGPSTKTHYWTFSGVSLINLNALQVSAEPGTFFETVAPPGSSLTRVLEKEFTIYDYGTLEMYEKSIWQTFQDSRLLHKLEELGAITREKLDRENRSYGSHFENVLNFTEKKINHSFPGIYLQFDDSCFRLWRGEVSSVDF